MDGLITPNQTRLIFITGTDTGVGKTLLTSLLLGYLRAEGCHALAMKPFCSGSRADAQLLYSLQNGELTLDEVNPFYFLEPVAPFVAARRHRRRIELRDVLDSIAAVSARQAPRVNSHKGNQRAKTRTPVLLIEGSGGLLVPLARGYNVRHLIASLDCEVLVVARNRLGTLNHTLLTVEALQTVPRYAAARSTPRRTSSTLIKVVLMNPHAGDCSSRSNEKVLAELLRPVPVFSMPFLGRKCCTPTAIKRYVGRIQKSLSQILF